MEEQKKKILFVCSANVDRSPTSEKVIREAYPEFETKSAGTSYYATIRLSKELVQWADIIISMEEWQAKHIMQEFEEFVSGKVIHYFDIPDQYEYMEPRLVTRILDKFEEFLKRH